MSKKLISVEAKKKKYAAALQRMRAKQLALNEKSGQVQSIREVKAAYYAMLARCYSKNCKSYHRYGGRGIGVCAEWREPDGVGFSAFYEHVGNRPRGRHSLDRINNNGNYEPGNVRWASHQEQHCNKGSNRWIELNGERMTLAQWAERLNISPSALSARLKKWSIEKALTAKSQYKIPRWHTKVTYAKR